MYEFFNCLTTDLLIKFIMEYGLQVSVFLTFIQDNVHREDEIFLSSNTIIPHLNI